MNRIQFLIVALILTFGPISEGRTASAQHLVCSTQAVQPGLYWIKTIFDDGTHYCLDQADDDPHHAKLVFSGCNRPKTQQFDVVPVANGCYQLRLHSANIAENNYRLLIVEMGPEQHPDGAKYLTVCVYPGIAGGCTNDYQTWVIQNDPGPYPGPPWPLGSTVIVRSVKNVEGYINGWCMDRRDDTGEGAAEPQFLDCREPEDLHERYIFQRADGAATTNWTPPQPH